MKKVPEYIWDDRQLRDLAVDHSVYQIQIIMAAPSAQAVYERARLIGIQVMGHRRGPLRMIHLTPEISPRVTVAAVKRGMSPDELLEKLVDVIFGDDKAAEAVTALLGDGGGG